MSPVSGRRRVRYSSTLIGPHQRSPFDNGPRVGEIGLAARNLHPHAKRVRVAEQFSQMQQAAMRGLEPRDMSARTPLVEGEAADAPDALDEPARTTVLEELFDHSAPDRLVTHVYRADRPPPEVKPLDWVVNRDPQVAL